MIHHTHDSAEADKAAEESVNYGSESDEHLTELMHEIDEHLKPSNQIDEAAVFSLDTSLDSVEQTPRLSLFKKSSPIDSVSEQDDQDTASDSGEDISMSPRAQMCLSFALSSGEWNK